jgi:predicted naringenin-chalcone synthase
MGQDSPRVALLSIGTAVPAYRFQQAALERWMVEALGSQPALSRQIKRLYELSGIETRHSCLADPLSSPSDSRFSPGRILADTPTTAERMAIYQREATVIGTARYDNSPHRR